MIVCQSIYRRNERPVDGICKSFDTHSEKDMDALARRAARAMRLDLNESVIREHDLEEWFGERD